MAGKATSTTENLDRELRALDMKRRGATYEAIGKDLGVSGQRAHQLVKKALDRHETPMVEELRAMEVERLDVMLVKAWEMYFAKHPYVSAGQVVYLVTGPDGGSENVVVVNDAGVNIAAGQLLLRIAERRAKLLGLDTPVPMKIQVLTEDVIDAELRRLAEQLGTEAVREAAAVAAITAGAITEVPPVPG
jgi:hypothetical protein